jgi:hypothetical protein
MKKLLLFTLLLSFSMFLQAQSNFKTYITLEFTDCLNCIQPLRQFVKIPQTMNPKLILQEKDKRYANKYLKEQMKVEISDTQIVFSDSIFKALNKDKTSSNVYIYSAERLLFQCELVQLSNKIDSIIELSQFKIEYKKILPDSVVLSDRTTIKYNNRNFYILDDLFKKTYSYDNITNTTYSIDTKKLSVQYIYKAIFGDTSKFYNKIIRYKSELGQFGKNEISIFSISTDKNSSKNQFYAYIVLYYGESEPSGGVGLKSASILAEYQDNQLKAFYKIDNAKKNALYPDYYGFDSNFHIQQEEITTMLYYEKPDTTKPHLGKLKLKNNELVIEKFIKQVLYPSFGEKKVGYEYMNVGGTIAGDYFFSGLEPQALNMKTGEKYQLPIVKEGENIMNDFSKIVVNYSLTDVIVLKNKGFKLLVKHKSGFELVELDEKMQLVKKQKLPILKDMVSSFFNENQIVNFKADTNQLVFITLP